MLGFGALGQLALGELPSIDYGPVPGAAGGTRRPRYVPQPYYGEQEVRRKPFRPVWDKPPVKIAPHVDLPPPGPVPMPPAGLLTGAVPIARPLTSAPPFGLPDFNSLVPPDPVGIGDRLREAQDMSDATAILMELHKMTRQ